MHGGTHKCITTCSALRRPLQYSKGSSLFTNFRFNKINMRELLADKHTSLFPTRLLMPLFLPGDAHSASFLFIHLHQWAVKIKQTGRQRGLVFPFWQWAKHDFGVFRRRCSVQSVLLCTLLMSQTGMRELKLYQRIRMCLSLECHGDHSQNVFFYFFMFRAQKSYVSSNKQNDKTPK